MKAPFDINSSANSDSIILPLPQVYQAHSKPSNKSAATNVAQTERRSNVNNQLAADSTTTCRGSNNSETDDSAIKIFSQRTFF